MDFLELEKKDIGILFQKYSEIMHYEFRLRPYDDLKRTKKGLRDVSKYPEEILRIVWQIQEVAQSNFISRSYNTEYNLMDTDVIYESVGGHANLVSEIVSMALDFYLNGAFGTGDSLSSFKTEDGYSYRDISEAVRLHDLPENESGDIADDGRRDETAKNLAEMDYFMRFLNGFPPDFFVMTARVKKLLGEMQEKSSFTGRLLYMSDKAAALLITLCLDKLGRSPMISSDSPYASDRDRAEMQICDFCSLEDHLFYYRASEMWTIDFFKIRNIVNYDDTFFFTAVIVMSTLAIHNRWYKWREKDYQDICKNFSRF